MSAPRPRRPGEASPSRLAAETYLRGGTTLKAAAAQYGVAFQTVHEVAARLRRERLAKARESRANKEELVERTDETRATWRSSPKELGETGCGGTDPVR